MKLTALSTHATIATPNSLQISQIALKFKTTQIIYHNNLFLILASIRNSLIFIVLILTMHWIPNKSFLTSDALFVFKLKAVIMWDHFNYNEIDFSCASPTRWRFFLTQYCYCYSFFCNLNRRFWMITGLIANFYRVSDINVNQNHIIRSTVIFSYFNFFPHITAYWLSIKIVWTKLFLEFFKCRNFFSKLLP